MRMKRSCFFYSLRCERLTGRTRTGLCEVLREETDQDPTAAGQQAIQDPRFFTFLLASTPASCLSGDITQLIMTRKIIAAQMMKTLDLWPQEDLHPTSIVRRDNLLSNQCLPVLLCGLRKAWKEADFCSLDLGWERGVVVTTQFVPYGQDMELEGWVKWGELFLWAYLVRQGADFGSSCYNWWATSFSSIDLNKKLI